MSNDELFSPSIYHCYELQTSYGKIFLSLAQRRHAARIKPFEDNALINPAKERSTVFSQAQIPEPAINMKGVYIMLQFRGHFSDTFRLNVPCRGPWQGLRLLYSLSAKTGHCLRRFLRELRPKTFERGKWSSGSNSLISKKLAVTTSIISTGAGTGIRIFVEKFLNTKNPGRAA